MLLSLASLIKEYDKYMDVNIILACNIMISFCNVKPFWWDTRDCVGLKMSCLRRYYLIFWRHRRTRLTRLQRHILVISCIVKLLHQEKPKLNEKRHFITKVCEKLCSSWVCWTPFSRSKVRGQFAACLVETNIHCLVRLLLRQTTQTQLPVELSSSRLLALLSVLASELKTLQYCGCS